ncbi:hypothetical protein jhhlp_004549 [Lomentospora prolificans]|uniref:Uncharacterized protein n=1 Tax=Lomentospora prolificans TaxID=41688 RepID=A0A2N3NBU4_9PEZI|nr:hypothetical protein jhhlp_004549 [Lomentospora prolificans]
MWISLPSTDNFSRPRLVIAAALSTVAVASASYYYFYRDGSHRGTHSTGLHRSNAIRRPRRNSRRRSRSTPAPRNASPAASTASTDDAVIDQILQEVEETVVDDDGQNGLEDWYNDPPPQRAGHNIVTLLFRVSEDNSRRNACVHRGCQCNACSMAPIRGIRYRCATCADFDLCESCEAQGLHTKTHIFYKVKVPAPPSILRQTQPVWYTGDPDSVNRSLSRHLMVKLSRETGFERPELEAYWEQWTYMANTEWRDDPDELNLAMDRKTFERCLIPSGASQHMAPNLIHDRMFAFYDTNNDGLIGFTEFLHGVAFRNRRDKLERIFRSYDIDNDGYIDRKDCLRMFRAYYVLFKGMHKDVLDGLDEQVMASTEAQQLVASRQPLSSLFGRELTRMPPADYNPDRLHGKVYHGNGDVDLPAGRSHAVREGRGDTASRRQVLNRIFINDAESEDTLREDTLRITAPAQYAESILYPLNNISAVQALLSTLEAEGALNTDTVFTNSEHTTMTPPEGESPPSESQNEARGTESPADASSATQGDEPNQSTADSQQGENSNTSGRGLRTLRITLPANGEGEVHVSVTASQLQDRLEQERSVRRRARRRLHERWRRRHFFLDEEEGARAPRGFDDSQDLLARAMEDLERAKEQEKELSLEADAPALSPRSRSSSKVRFAGDTDELETRSNVSVSSRTVPERWGGMDIPDAERDAGKEILYQVAQQAFNDLLDVLFKDKEGLAMQVAKTREDREKYAELAAAYEASDESEDEEEPADLDIESIDEDGLEEIEATTETPAPAIDEAEAPHTTEAALDSPKNGTEGSEEKDGESEGERNVGRAIPALSEDTDPVEEYRDPTMPQFRPNSEAEVLDLGTIIQPTAHGRVDEPEEKCGEEEGLENGSRPVQERDESPASKERRQRKELEDKYHDTFANIMAEWKACGEAEAEALARGGFGKISFAEFEKIYRERESTNNLAYLGSWIEFCIP